MVQGPLAPDPVGAAAVKELFGSTGSEVLGYAVMVKVEEGTAADSWYYYEDYNGTDYADGIGPGLCTGCHSGGTDYVLTPWPLQ